MRKFILTIFLLFSSFSLSFAEEASHLRLSLLTCSPGNSVASAFGHSALRVCDSLRNVDLIFNYGTYSFDEPNFLLKFLMGDMHYCLSVSEYNSFKNYYSRQGRSIVEQVFNLTEKQKSEVYAFLMNNYRKENRYYYYEFFLNNCATKIRDIFEGEGYASYDEKTETTYRNEVKRTLGGNRRWMMFGINLLLGDLTDKEISTRGKMFLPDMLSCYLEQYSNTELNDESLLLPASSVYDAPKANKPVKTFFAKITSPEIIFILLFLAFLILYLKLNRRNDFVRIFRLVFYIILSVGGTILAFMWFGTHHIWTKMNWNLLWMSPLYLLPLFFRPGKVSAVIGDILAALSALTLIFSWLIPQSFDMAVYFIILLEIAVALSYHQIILHQNQKKD